MQRPTVTTLVVVSAMFALTSPIGAGAADVVSEMPKIQITIVDGKPFVTNAAPNPPITIPAAAARTGAAIPLLDDRMPAPIQTLVHRISTTHGVDPQLVAAVMKVESNYDPGARSSKGALGLMQLIPATGQRFGVRHFFDPEENIEGGVRYLRFLSDKFGPSKLELILAAYNAGENLVERLRAVPAIPETRDYVRKVQKIYKPSAVPALVSASDDVKPVVETAAPEPKAARIYRSVDERGVVHYSNIGPPN